jgi:hypothetical protein
VVRAADRRHRYKTTLGLPRYGSRSKISSAHVSLGQRR